MDLTEVGLETAGVCADVLVAEPPRLRRPDRNQALMQTCWLDEVLPADHQARTIWAVVEKLDLAKFHEPLRARGSDPGRSATDPKLLVALWLYATMEGIGSGREIARLCECHDAFRWLCGGVPVNYHTLNDFRVGHEKALDDLFTEVVAVLTHKGVVSVKRISQDGTKVRANAGAGSFRKEGKLREHLAAAKAQVEAVKQLADDRTVSAAKRAAQERAAREREERITAALAELPKIQEDKIRSRDKKSIAKAPRASTTDPDARVMKMPDNGFRPAYNVQLAVDPSSRAIVGAEVTNARTDTKEAEPLREQVERRTGQKVEEHLVDGGYVQKDRIEQAEARGTKMYAPVPKARKDPRAYEVKKTDGPGVAAWRQRMAGEEGKAIYSQRGSTVETVNADLKMFRGLSRMVVRGLKGVRCQVLWSSLAYNLLHFAPVWIT
ncbi:MAG: IS1182 family transposase [Planctomycetota bacterium]